MTSVLAMNNQPTAKEIARIEKRFSLQMEGRRVKLQGLLTNFLVEEIMRNTGQDKVIDVEVLIIKQTEKAVLVKSADTLKQQWLPLSQVEVHNDGTITLPEWLAIEKELV